MAMAPLRLCGCGKKIPGGTICPCQARKKAFRDKQRPNARQRGYDGRWQRERSEFLALPGNDKCECGKPAKLIDHKIPHRGNKELMWDHNNWKPMCWSCHSKKTASQDGGFGNPRKFGDS